MTRFKWLRLVWGYRLRCWIGVVGAYATPRKIGKWLAAGGYWWCCWYYPWKTFQGTMCLLGLILLVYLCFALGTNSWDLKGMNDDDIDRH